jgi:uncharacterized protein YegL
MTWQMHLFFLLDSSGSMTGPRIAEVNAAMRTIGEAVDRRGGEEGFIPRFHVLTFNSGVWWLCGTSALEGITGAELAQRWQDLQTGGSTDTAAAIREILPGLTQSALGRHGIRPLIVLVTDGMSNQPWDTLEAVRALSAALGGRTTRAAIGIGGYDPAELEAFASTGQVVLPDGAGVPEERKLIFDVKDIRHLAGLLAAVSKAPACPPGWREEDAPPVVRLPGDEDDW